MSSSFDAMAAGLKYILDQFQDLDSRTNDMFHFLEQAIERLHDIDHEQQGALNHSGPLYKAAEGIRVCLQHPDEEKRKEWLKAKGII